MATTPELAAARSSCAALAADALAAPRARLYYVAHANYVEAHCWMADAARGARVLRCEFGGAPSAVFSDTSLGPWVWQRILAETADAATVPTFLVVADVVRGRRPDAATLSCVRVAWLCNADNGARLEEHVAEDLVVAPPPPDAADIGAALAVARKADTGEARGVHVCVIAGRADGGDDAATVPVSHVFVPCDQVEAVFAEPELTAAAAAYAPACGVLVWLQYQPTGWAEWDEYPVAQRTAGRA